MTSDPNYMRKFIDIYAQQEREDPYSHLPGERYTIALKNTSASDAYKMYRLVLNMLDYKNDLKTTSEGECGVMTFYSPQHFEIAKRFLDSVGEPYSIVKPNDLKELSDTNTVSPLPKKNSWWGS